MTTTTWTNALADNDGEAAGNWDNGVPSSILDVVVTGAANITFATGITAKTLDCTGYTGTFTASVLVFHGSVTLASGMTLAGFWDAEFKANATIISAGKTWLGNIYSADAITITLGDDLTIGSSGVTLSGSAVFAFGANDLTLASGGVLTVGTVTYSAGAHVIISGGSTSIDSGSELPPTTVTSCAITTHSGIYAKSYTQTGGSLLIDGSGGGITDAMTLTNLTNIGLTFDAGWSAGSLVSNNCVYDGTGFAFTWNITGAATGTGDDVSDCDFSAGSDFDVTDGVNGGGNTGVNFLAGNAAPVADAGIDQTVTVVPRTVTLDGSATDADGGDVLTYLWSKVSGTGTVVFVDATDPQTDATLPQDGAYVLRLTVSDGTDTDTDDVTITADTVSATVTNVTSAHANGTFAASEVIDIQVTWDEAVTKTGTPQLLVRNKPHSTTACNYLSGSGTATIVFRYTAAAGDHTPDLEAVSINLNGGTLKDSGANNVSLALPAAAAAGSLSANKNIAIFNGDSTYAPRPNKRRLGMLR